MHKPLIEKQCDVAIILPAYNEERTIKETIIAFHSALPYARIYVINNNSSDRTEAIAKATLADLPCLGGVLDESRQGKGNALRRAFMSIDADIYLLVDADMTYPADQAADLIYPIIESRCRHGCGRPAFGRTLFARKQAPAPQFRQSADPNHYQQVLQCEAGRHYERIPRV